MGCRPTFLLLMRQPKEDNDLGCIKMAISLHNQTTQRERFLCCLWFVCKGQRKWQGTNKTYLTKMEMAGSFFLIPLRRWPKQNHPPIKTMPTCYLNLRRIKVLCWRVCFQLPANSYMASAPLAPGNYSLSASL